MLDPARLGIAGGITWGISIFTLTILSIYTGYAEHFLTSISGLYLGYSISWPGSIAGLISGFLDAFGKLFLTAWIYNKLNA